MQYSDDDGGWFAWFWRLFQDDWWDHLFRAPRFLRRKTPR